MTKLTVAFANALWTRVKWRQRMRLTTAFKTCAAVLAHSYNSLAALQALKTFGRISSWLLAQTHIIRIIFKKMSYYITHSGLFITKAKGLRVFRERVAIYCDNHTYCMEQRPSWDLLLAQLVKKFSKLNADRRFINEFTQPDIYPCRIHFFPLYSLDIQFSVVVSTPWSSGLPFWIPPPKKNPYMHFSSSPVRATCHVHLIFHDWSSE